MLWLDSRFILGPPQPSLVTPVSSLIQKLSEQFWFLTACALQLEEWSMTSGVQGRRSLSDKQSQGTQKAGVRVTRVTWQGQWARVSCSAGVGNEY